VVHGGTATFLQNHLLIQGLERETERGREGGREGGKEGGKEVNI